MRQIPVWAFLREKGTPPPRFSKVSGLSRGDASSLEAAKVEREITHHLHDDDETEVPKEFLTKAYRYGKTLVPFLKTDEANMKLQTEKSLKVLCFVRTAKASSAVCWRRHDVPQIPRHHFMGGALTVFVPAPGDAPANVALSGTQCTRLHTRSWLAALAHALHEKDMYAVVRYVARANAAPKLGICFPVCRQPYCRPPHRPPAHQAQVRVSDVCVDPVQRGSAPICVPAAARGGQGRAHIRAAAGGAGTHFAHGPGHGGARR